MKRPIDIIDDFYTKEELQVLERELNIDRNQLDFAPTCQPFAVRKNLSSRFQAYPCHETYRVDEKNDIYINLFNKLKEHVKPDIKKIRTFFRKIYRDELEKSVCYTGKGLIHNDAEEFQLAGVIYLDDGYSFNAGTNLFTTNKYGEQFEHDIQVGSVFNRCIVYPADILHQPSFDMNLKSRFIQTFFIFKDEESENKDKKYDINNCI